MSLMNTTQRFLEAVYRLEKRFGIAKTGELGKMLNVVPGTITNTVERLEKKGLILHSNYKGIKLTTKGKQLAINALRRHRLSERLLTDILKMEPFTTHKEAFILERGLSEEVTNHIEKILSFPKTCPHGNPIPTKEGKLIEEKSEPLINLKKGEKGKVIKIYEEKQIVLEQLKKLEINPGTIIEIIEKPPEEWMHIKINKKYKTISQKIGSLINIKKIDVKISE